MKTAPQFLFDLGSALITRALVMVCLGLECWLVALYTQKSQ